MEVFKMRNQFLSGVLFTVGMAMFGKSMYKLGRLDEKREDLKLWKSLIKELKQIEKEAKKKEKES